MAENYKILYEQMKKIVEKYLIWTGYGNMV